MWYVTETEVIPTSIPLQDLARGLKTIYQPLQAQKSITIGAARYPCINIAL